MTPSQSIVLLPLIAPICLWVAFSDLRRMKIPNLSIMALIGVYGVVGPFVFPFETWLWGWAHVAVMLAVGIAINAAGLMGAGDAKFIAAAAAFVPVADLLTVGYILSATIVVSLIAHRIAKYSPLRQLAPDWESWSSGNRFPMGLPLGTGLILYLLQALV